jgi:hypothetical protein
MNINKKICLFLILAGKAPAVISSSTPLVSKPERKPTPAKSVTAPVSQAAKAAQEKSFIKAIQQGDFDKVEELLEDGVSANAKDADGETALMHACKRGELDMVKLLLEKRARVNATTMVGETALMFAAKKGNKKIVELLIENDADVDARDSFGGYTPLMLATMSGHLPVVELLVEHKAATNTVSKQKYTALDYAVQGKHKGIESFLKEKGSIATVQEKTTQIAKPGEYRPPVRPNRPSLGSSGDGYAGGGYSREPHVGSPESEYEREREREREMERESRPGREGTMTESMEEEMLRERMREIEERGELGEEDLDHMRAGMGKHSQSDESVAEAEEEQKRLEKIAESERSSLTRSVLSDHDEF